MAKRVDVADMVNDRRGGDVVRLADAAAVDKIEDATADVLPDLAPTAAEILRSDLFKKPRHTYPTGLAALDEKIGGGLKSRQQSIIAAPTGYGKTQLVGTLKLHFAKQNYPVMWFCTELGEDEQAARFAALAMRVASRSGYTPDDLLSHVLPPEDAARAVDDLPIHIVKIRRSDGDPFVIIAGQMAAARAKYGRAPLGVVDYMQKLAVEDEDRRRVSVSNVSERLLEIAQDFDTHMLVISSVARNLYNRTARKLRKQAEDEDPRDWLAVGKESGDIEYDAAVMMYLDVADERDALGQRNARLIVAKCRQGSEGFVGLKFHGPTGLFTADDAAAEAMRPEVRQKVADDIEQKVIDYLKTHAADPPTRERLRTAFPGVGVNRVANAVKALDSEGLIELREVTYTDRGNPPRQRKKKVVVLTPDEGDHA